MKIGIDLGGTKTELIALDDTGVEQMRLRWPTPAGDYQATVSLLAALVKEAESTLQVSATVGIGTPGAVSQLSGRMKNCNSTCLNDQPFKQDIECVLNREVRLSNDANCFALSEAVDGEGAGADVVFGVILGTGVGAGLVVHGRVLEGINLIAGEWDHNPLPNPKAAELPGPDCYCGRTGCIEAWLSGPAMSADHQRKTGEYFDAAKIASRAEQNKTCHATLESYTERLSRSLAHVINILDPDVIVLGGGLSNIAYLYQRLPLLWQAHVFSDHVHTQLLPPKHGDSSGVRGAAWLWGR
jgi:fructokinase/N-acetylglucosamine kinase